MRFLLPSFALLLAADNGGATGGAPAAKPPSLDAQLTAAQARVTELEGLQTAWTGERTQLVEARDAALKRATELTTQLSTATAEQSRLTGRVRELEGQMAAAGGTITALTGERDRFKTLAENPSAQAQQILATAGGAPVAMRPDANSHPAEAGKGAATNAAGKTGLAAAMAKNIAKAKDKKP